ncbi:UDP-N-acetylmuramoyl-tripeptide--D-alanyl-D-alanine ligase [Aquibacillus saliphilus]|uniref:UDP-N-acetylmuramoyl-tripeptide--D-alanyl-D- alanine ligase n=1 Tax=Aquibacillus saliphilus TaxID=1909422 RepID=UPI001CEFD3A1|nr:UDP-N-acetylmuramoyl-tripeptide--D-alanyl-D-alanine ligase [Aquibacillus saliphilus]
MLFSTSFLSELFPDTKGAALDNIPILEVTTDSRKKSKKSLFIPLKGESFDGHDFIKDAFNNGAVATIWEKNRELPAFLPTDFPVFFVEDTLVTLQRLASVYRQDVNPIVVGVTGSNGKTTTKDLIGTILQSHYKTHRTKGNFNNQIGLPLTILSMNRETEMLVLEMGMDHFGEIELLSKIAKPDYAVITNIGESHIEYLGSREGIAQAKLEILSGMKENGLLIIDGDEPLLTSLKTRDNVLSIGFDKDNDVIVENYSMTTKHTLFTLNNQIQYQLNLLGKHNVKNAIFAIKIAEKLNVPMEKIHDSLLNIELTGMRFEIISGKNNVTIINDAYNASPTSMKASIEVLKQMESYPKKMLILGDIFELGEHSKRLHRTVAEVITEEIDVVFTVGSDAREISKQLVENKLTIETKHFNDKDQLLNSIDGYLNDQTIILLKASRGMKFETILEDMMNE